MTISSESCQCVPASVVISNFEMLRTFEKGDKPITRGSTLSKEGRYLATVRRALEGAFDPQVLENTFYSASEICKKAKQPYLHERPEELMSYASEIRKLAEGALEGLKKAEASYRNEAKTVYWKSESKTYTADKIKHIYDTYYPLLSPKKRSVSALISVFEPGKTLNTSLQGEKKEQSQVASARAFWKKQETQSSSSNVKSVEQAPKIKVCPEQKQEPQQKVVVVVVKRPEPPPPPPKEKISVPKRRVTTILRRMAQDTLDQVRSKKKKKKPYKEKSFIRLFTKGKKKPAGSVIEELAQFGSNSEEVSKRYEYFESYQEELRRKRNEEKKKEQVSCFDLSMLARVVEDYDGIPDDERSDDSSHASWNDHDEQVLSMRRDVIQRAQNRPLTRSVSVYPGTVNQHKTPTVFSQAKPSSLDDNCLRERLQQIRTHTQYSYSGEDRTEDDFSSDEDPFDED